MPTWITGISLKAWAYIAAFFAILGAFWKVYAAGKTAARVEGMQEQLDNVKDRNDVEVGVGLLNDSDISEQLRNKWQRD